MEVEYTLMIPIMPSKFQQTYLIEERKECVFIHRKLAEDEFIWYESNRILEYSSHLYVKNISEHESVSEAIEKVKKFWKETSAFCFIYERGEIK